jgi:hypothetical protein
VKTFEGSRAAWRAFSCRVSSSATSPRPSSIAATMARSTSVSLGSAPRAGSRRRDWSQPVSSPGDCSSALVEETAKFAGDGVLSRCGFNPRRATQNNQWWQFVSYVRPVTGRFSGRFDRSGTPKARKAKQWPSEFLAVVSSRSIRYARSPPLREEGQALRTTCPPSSDIRLRDSGEPRRRYPHPPWRRIRSTGPRRRWGTWPCYGSWPTPGSSR